MEFRQSPEPNEQRGANPGQQEESPLYEFAAPPAPAQEQTNEQAHQPQNEPEFVYPPPPSYYQNLQVPAERPPLPGQPPAAASPTPSKQPPYSQGAYPPQWRPPVKRSRKQTWIIVSIIIGSVLLLCGAGSWALYNVMGTVFQQVNGAPQVVQDFYQQVQSQNYTAAFHDLSIRGQTPATFTQAAQALDTRYGPVKSFQIGSTTIGSGTSSAWQISVSVTRSKAAYAVFVSVDNAGGSWKITSIDLTRF